MPSKLPRDLLVFFAFIALPVAGFLLAGTTDTQFYVSLLTISLLGIFGFRFYYSDETDRFLDFSHELDLFSFVLIIVGVIGSLFISSFLISEFASQSLTSLVVPIPQTALAIGSIQLPPFWSDILFTLTLVAPAEECSKLVTSLGLYVWLQGISKRIAEIVSFVVPIAIWASLHGYVAYATSPYMMVYIASAFFAGLLIFYVMKKTNSLLAAILVHSLYNIVILFLTVPLP